MTENAPLVSVLMPAYNTERYIAQAIDSILKQTYTNFEFLIQDDCSTDNTLQIINSFDDPRINVQRNESNLKAGATRNILMDRAKGEYVALMDSDDICRSDRLQVQVDFMRSHPEVALCGSYVDFMYEDGTPTGHTNRYPLDYEEIKASVFFCHPFAQPTVMARIMVLRDNDLRYMDDPIVAEDSSFFSNVVSKINCVNLPEPFLLYRIWESQLSSQYKNVQFSDSNKVVLSRLKEIGIELPDEEFRVLRSIASDWTSVISANELDIYLKVMVKLWRANMKHKLYNNSVFRKMLIHYHKDAYKRSNLTHFQKRVRKIKLRIQLL